MAFASAAATGLSILHDTDWALELTVRHYVGAIEPPLAWRLDAKPKLFLRCRPFAAN